MNRQAVQPEIVVTIKDSVYFWNTNIQMDQVDCFVSRKY